MLPHGAPHILLFFQDRLFVLGRRANGGAVGFVR